jgi:hypothetical protein
MQTLQMIQQLDAATIVVTALILPWAAVMLMHAVSARAQAGVDTAWNIRAEAAARWTRAVILPANNRVLPFTARRAARSNTTYSPVLNAA